MIPLLLIIFYYIDHLVFFVPGEEFLLLLETRVASAVGDGASALIDLKHVSFGCPLQSSRDNEYCLATPSNRL